MKKFLLNVLLVGSLFAGTYDDAYTGLDKKDSNTTQKLDQFMYGNFAEIVRFNILDFSNGYLNDDANQSFDDIKNTIKSYIKDDREIKIKVIGHASQRTDDYNELAVDSKTYANKIQNTFRFSQDLNETMDNSKDFAESIAADLVDSNISKDIIFVEYRGSEEIAYTTETDESRDLSNRVMVTMYVLNAKKDTDGDGVYDSTDECPQTPEGVKVDEVGCPLDTDKDGVPDYKDDCPNTPEGVVVDEHGCPLDTDKDGVPDYKDDCPNTPEGVAVDEHGCPFDTDEDGVPDYKDDCPNTPEGVAVDEHGCPLDTDKDGVPDYKDDCPNTPEGVAVDERGCPFDTDEDGVVDYLDKCPGTEKGLTVDEHGCPLTMVLNIHYGNDCAKIPEADYPEILEFAEFLKANMPYSAEIIGHTDSIGKLKDNIDLSMRRAAGVKEALIKEGISKDRLKATGKGELEPISTNKTAEGRILNRRTEVKVFY